MNYYNQFPPVLVPNNFKVIYITSTQSFTVPADFNPNNNMLELIGEGGTGDLAYGGGGAYTRVINIQDGPGDGLHVDVGQGGETLQTLWEGTVMLVADCGKNAVGSTPGEAGLAANAGNYPNSGFRLSGQDGDQGGLSASQESFGNGGAPGKPGNAGLIRLSYVPV